MVNRRARATRNAMPKRLRCMLLAYLFLVVIRHARQSLGGAVANIGGDFTCNAGSIFFDGFAENSGDGGSGGGIYNEDGGVVT